jgi:hypothetical protein
MLFTQNCIFRISILAILFSGFTHGGSAQKQITRQSLYFLRYEGSYRISPRWSATLEIENRRFFNGSRNLDWILPRIAVVRSLGSGWSAAAGFSYYRAAKPGEAGKPIAVDVPELRPHQQLSYKQDLGKLTIAHRYRLEERFARRTTADNRLAPGHVFHFRMRYRLTLAYALIPKAGPGSLRVKLSDELMYNLGHRIVGNSFDQNQLYLGFNYGVSPSVQLELGYMNAFQQRSTADQYYSRDLARVTFYHFPGLRRPGP